MQPRVSVRTRTRGEGRQKHRGGNRTERRRTEDNRRGKGTKRHSTGGHKEDEHRTGEWRSIDSRTEDSVVLCGRQPASSNATQRGGAKEAPKCLLSDCVNQLINTERQPFTQNPISQETGPNTLTNASRLFTRL